MLCFDRIDISEGIDINPNLSGWVVLPQPPPPPTPPPLVLP